MMKRIENRAVRNILLQCGVVIMIACMLLISAANVSAQDTVMRRYGLYVGSNYGGRERVTLSYAVTDARAISEVMQQLGGIMPTDSIILTDPSPSMLKHTIGEIKKSINSDTTKRSEFFFYYSGHSDEKGLLLGDTVYEYEKLKDSIDSVEADVNIAVLDSCSSGAFTRMKGGVRRSPFLSDESVNATGHAFLTSSSEDEAAQESDDLEASFFTHYFITALRGAADSTLDGTVSLNEAYSYASSETLARTEDTLAGPQHPSYDIQLAGTGDLVLTDLRSVSEQIMFDKDLRGRIFVRDGAGRLVVELKKIEGSPLAVSIGPGRYSMILDDGNQLQSADLMLTGGSKILVMKDEFYPVPRSYNQTRGGTHIASDDGRSVDKPFVEQDEDYQQSVASVAEDEDRTVSDTAAELDVIAERARKRALEAAGMSSGNTDDDEDVSAAESEYYETENGSVKFTPSSGSGVSKKDIYTEETGFDIPAGYDNGFNFGLIADADNMNGVQLGIIGADVGGNLNGAQIAAVYTDVSANASGAQVAGVYCNAEGDVDGIQVAGVWNTAGGDVMGAQVSGVWNTADEVAFLQMGGVFNLAEGRVMGLQTAGVFNIAETQVLGGQISGVFNTAGEVAGVQVAGVLNIADEVKGAQIGPLNFGGDVYGIQVGLINISDEMHGLPIGLINISGDGLHDMSVWYTDAGFVNFSYQLGTSTAYSFMNVGFSEDWNEAASFGLGMGLEFGGDVLFLDTELYAKSYQSGHGSAVDNLQSIFSGAADIYPALRLSAGLELFDFISVFGGVNFDCSFSFTADGYTTEVGETAAASYSVAPVKVDYDYGVIDMYPSWFIGVRM